MDGRWKCVKLQEDEIIEKQIRLCIDLGANDDVDDDGSTEVQNYSFDFKAQFQ